MSLSTQNPKLKVLISGAGIAGPCLAYWLTRTRLNTSITVVERSPVPRVTGQSIDIRGPAISVIERMKLKEAVQVRHTTEEGTRIVNSSGKTIAEFGRGDSLTAEYEILRADLCQLFMDATKPFSNVHYIYGDYVTSLQQTKKDAQVAFASGATETFDLVVGADGSASKIRSMILDEETRKNSYKFIGQYIAYFSIPKNSQDTKHWYWYNAPKGLGLMTRPHRNNETVGVYMCVTTPAHGIQDLAVEKAIDQGLEAQKQILHQYFENAGWQAKRILEGLDQTRDFYMSKAAQVKLPKWTNGRTVVLGDAAFATFGIGTSLAIESAYFLAGELSKIKTSEDIPKALISYEDTFCPLYAKDEELPPAFPQIAFPQTAWALRLRDSALWIVSKTKAYKLLPKDGGHKFDLPDYDWVGV
ncbi:hypothetical protein ACN47E_007801 [Coniothyrium glycines]